MMSGIRGKNTKPEIFLRKRLHAEVSRWESFVSAVSLVLNPKLIEE